MFLLSSAHITELRKWKFFILFKNIIFTSKVLLPTIICLPVGEPGLAVAVEGALQVVAVGVGAAVVRLVGWWWVRVVGGGGWWWWFVVVVVGGGWLWMLVVVVGGGW